MVSQSDLLPIRTATSDFEFFELVFFAILGLKLSYRVESDQVETQIKSYSVPTAPGSDVILPDPGNTHARRQSCRGFQS